MKVIEQYQLFETVIKNADNASNVESGVVFECNEARRQIAAYKSDENAYTLRFMPDKTGIWNYRGAVAGQEVRGSFECTQATGENHGPVRASGYRFQYADGAGYMPFGTTCYAWVNQTKELQEQTLLTLKASPFNKIRMCIFPKSMPYNNNDPVDYPFYQDEAGSWDTKKINFRFWDNLDCRIGELAELGIEADIILFHPYDRWGFAELSTEDSNRYLEYCGARLSAFRNVWWSLANEYEMLYSKSNKDWDGYGERLRASDPYGHLMSVHNIFQVYPKRSWMTHCSIQTSELNNIGLWKKEYQMPIIIDECGYEGNIEFGWGNLSAFEMVHRFWWTLSRGGFCTHGETFHREDEVLWWAKGGYLYGESVPRIGFLKSLLEELGEGEVQIPSLADNPNFNGDDEESIRQRNNFHTLVKSLPEHRQDGVITNIPMIISGENYRLEYLGRSCPGLIRFELPQDGDYLVEVIDIWEMTRKVAADHVNGQVQIDLPGKEGIAVLARRR